MAEGDFLLEWAKYMRNFTLKKWYLDIADDKGNVYIGYNVSLRWGVIELHGFQHLWRTKEEGVKSKIGFTEVQFPKFVGDKLIWNIGDIKACWKSIDSGIIEEVLFKDKAGKIDWKCVQPKARAYIKSPELSFDGLGYTEYMKITLPVWKLPFKVLYWGRCHSKNHYLVWVRWDGITNQNLIWHNGKRSKDFTITDAQIIGRNFHLKFGQNYSLREGKIASIVGDSSDKIIQMIPKETFLAEEHKWYNRGIIETSSGSETAIIIHEKVLW